MTRRGAALCVGLVLVAAAALRLWAFAGVSGHYLADDSRYVAVAQNLAHGMAPDGDGEWFGGRVAFLWPVATAFRVWGAGDVTAVAWPLVVSCLAVVAAYLVAWELTGRRRIAVTAAALVAFTPLEVLVATRLRPDAVMPAFIALAVWAALRSRRAHVPWRWSVLAGAFIGVAWSAREMALVMVPIVVLAAGTRDVRRLAAGVAGALAVVAVACGAVAVAGGSWTMPLTGTAGASQARSPWGAFAWDQSYAAWALTHVAEPRHPAVGAVVVLAAAALLLAAARPWAAVVPAVWAAWGYVYLEFVALVNLTPSPRFLTLITLPLAVLVAMAADRVRWGEPAVAGAALVAACLVAYPVATRLDRPRDVERVAHLTLWLRDQGATHVLSEDYVTFAKLNLFLARDRLPVPRAQDPGFAAAPDPARIAADLPPVEGFRGGYVVVVPARPQVGRPANWGAYRARIRADVPLDYLREVARIDDAVVLRWGGGG